MIINSKRWFPRLMVASVALLFSSLPPVHAVDLNAVEMEEHMAAMKLVDHAFVTHSSVQDGNWSDSATWGGTLPADGARVLITSGHTVTVDGDISETMMTVRVDGLLRFATNVNTALRVDTLVTGMESSFEMGTVDAPVPANVTARLIINDLNDGIETDDASSPDYDPFQLGQGVISHGRFEMHGTEKPPYAKTVAARIDDLSLILDEVPTGWNVGDTIAIAGTDRNGNGDELRVITDIDGLMVYLDAALEKDHVPPRHTKEGLELRIHIANLTRNAVIETADANRGPSLDSVEDRTDRYLQRGHVMFMHNNDVDVRYAEFSHLGRSNKFMIADDTQSGADGEIIHIGTNPRARYPVHFHRSGRDGSPAIVHGNAVANGPGWGYVNHGGNVMMTNNVAYNIRGASFVSERGDEKGAFLANLAIKSHNRGIPKSAGNIKTGRGVDDFGFRGEGFWLQSHDVLVMDNIVSGASRAAFSVWPGLIDGASRPNHMLMENVFNNQAYGNQTAFSIGRLRGGKTVRNQNVGFVAWANGGLLNTIYAGTFAFVDLVLLGDIDNPYGTGLASRPSLGVIHRNYVNPHVEGFLIGWDTKMAAKPGSYSGYYNNVVNILHDNSHNPLRKGNNDIPTNSAYGNLTFGTMDGEGLALGLERVNALEVLEQQWDSNGYDSQVLTDQTDYLFIYSMKPRRETDITKVFLPHRQWLEIEGTSYEVFLKREQSGDYMPYPVAMWETGHRIRADVPLEYRDKTNLELQAMGVGVVSGHLLPAFWQSNDDFIDATTDEFRNATGLNLYNTVLKQVLAGDPNEIRSVEAVDDVLIFSEATPVGGGYRYWKTIPKNDVLHWNTLKRHDVVLQSEHGHTVRKRRGQFNYRPDSEFSGVDNFHYAIRDVFGMTSIATAYVVVGSDVAPDPLSRAPVVTNDEYAVAQGTTLDLDVLSNDTDPEGEGMTVHSVARKGIGTVTLLDGRLEYTAPAYYTGRDRLEYTVIDTEGMVSMKGVVMINVTP